MKILIAASPLTGHVNPLLAVGRAAAARGDAVLVLTDPAFRPKVEAAGLRFTGYPDNDSATFRETDLPAGPERYRREFERRFIDPMPVQAATLRRLIAEEAPDVIVAGSMFLGVLPRLLDTAPRPPIATVNVSFLFLDRPDHAPVGLGLPPARDQAEQVRYAALKAGMDAAFVNPVRAYTDAQLAKLGLPPIPASLTHSIVLLPDLFLQPTVPGFEYDYGTLPPGVRFIGLLQPPTPPAPLPDWWPELERANAAGKPVVLVTQGTLANADFGELVEPTLAALAHRDDLLVLATTGGRPVDALRGPIPANTRVSCFLPFRELLPRVSVLVTNGGYGSVSQALSAGVPIVSAGLTEDKAEVNARIGWSGVGVNLGTNAPTSEAVGEAVSRVLDDPGFRQRAGRIGEAFAARDAMAAILMAVDDLGRSGARAGRDAVPMARSA